jgi:hypothetical protein
MMALSIHQSARPREGGDPESRKLDSRLRGNERSLTARLSLLIHVAEAVE